MIRQLFAALACLALASCTAAGGITGLPDSPGTVADSTVKDEQAILGVELAYKAARLAVETAVDAGLIRGEAAARFQTLNRSAYASVQAARTAYRTANARSYRAAVADARRAVEQLLALAG